jgi:hypothetical protein
MVANVFLDLRRSQSNLAIASRMLFPLIRNIGLLALGALMVVNPALGAKQPKLGNYDLTEVKEPLGPLKVTLDYGLATTWPTPLDLNGPKLRRNWQFSTHIVLANSVDEISDGQLWQIARDAVDEMIADRKQYLIGDQAQPTAMGILAWGNEIILASSMKGVGSFSYDFLGGDNQVGRRLEMCQMLWGGDRSATHKNKGNCAEEFAVHLYHRQNHIELKDQNPRIGTWVFVDPDWQQIDPCGTGENVSNQCPHKLILHEDQLTNVQDFWGCNLFVQGEGMRVMDKETPPELYTLANLAGGRTRHEQIQLCGGDPRVFFP